MTEAILEEIEAFLLDSGMAPTYFGKRSCGNSELVARLRAGTTIQLDTERRVRNFIGSERRRRELPATAEPATENGPGQEQLATAAAP